MISTPMSLSRATVLTPLATTFSASMSRPESVSSSTARRGCWSASWRISMRFFSPPEKPSLRYRELNSLGTLVSSIAASTVLRKSLRLISGSSRASRWAFITMRRYLVTVTPGIATGYWKAMKRPARARSSGSASVMSLPSNRIWPSVTSKPGWPMIALASVDLPDPLGPISAWTSLLCNSRSRPLRICLSPAATWRLRICSSAIDGHQGGLRSGCAGGEGDQLGEGRALHCLDHAALDARPQQLGGAPVAVVGLVGAQHALAVTIVDEAGHRCDRALEREHRLVHRDLRGGARQPVAAMRAARALDEAGLLQHRHDPLEVGERQSLALGDRFQRDRFAVAVAPELDEQPHAVLGLRREDHGSLSYQRGRNGPRPRRGADRGGFLRRRRCRRRGSARRRCPSWPASTGRPRARDRRASGPSRARRRGSRPPSRRPARRRRRRGRRSR